MPRLLLLIALLALCWYAYRYIQQQPPSLRGRAIFKVMAIGLGAVVVLLSLTGRLHWLGAVIALTIPVLKWALTQGIRYMPLLARWWPHLKMGTSVFSSSLLKLRIDPMSANIDGDIVQGEFSGRKLSELSGDEADRFLAYCYQYDKDAYRLASYYFRAHQQKQTPPPQSSSGMTREEALAVLGLTDSASDKEVIAAHRRMMQKVHPDRGGSDYLAARVNEARDKLLG